METLLPPATEVDQASLNRQRQRRQASLNRQRQRRRDRWRLRALVARMGDNGRHRLGGWEHVPFARQAGCGRIVHGDQVDVHVKDGRSYPVGVSTCSSVWSCPVCEAKIRTGRAVELRQLAAAHAATGGTVSMMTLTVRHNRGNTLGELLEAEADAYRSLQQDQRWRNLREFGLVGQVRSWEVTQGFTVDPETGSWHPHFHILMLWDDDAHVGYETDWIAEAWAERIERRLGLRPDDHGFDHRIIPIEDVEYISKISDEITRADLKGGSRSIWALVEHAVEGDAAATSRWLEYVRATHGRRAVQYSRGLRARYELEEEATDDELAQADADGTKVHAYSKSEWSWLMRPAWGEVPKAVAALEQWEPIAHNVGTGREPDPPCVLDRRASPAA